MVHWLRIRSRYARVRAFEWLRSHPRVDRFLRDWGCLRLHGGAVPRGVAVGLFVGLTPTLGLQTLLMVAGCMAVRGNFPSAFAVSWVSNPLTIAPLYVAFNAIGEGVFRPLLASLFTLPGAADAAVLETMFLALGSLCVAVPVAAGGYAVAHLLELRLERRRRRRRAGVPGGGRSGPGA